MTHTGQPKSVSPIDTILFILKTSLKWLAMSLVLLLLILLLLLMTETGSRWLLQQAFSSVEQLSVAEINGTLASNLRLKNVKYQQADHFSVEIEDVSLQWQMSTLLRAHVQVSLLEFSGIKITGQAETSEEKNNSAEIPKIPLTINAERLLVKQFQWLNGESKTDIQQLALTAKLVQNKLNISKLDLTMPNVHLQAESEIQLQKNWPLTAKLDWSYSLQQEVLSGQLAVNGTLQQYNLQSVINNSIESEQSGFIKLSGNQPAFKLKGDWQKIQWPLAGTKQYSSKVGNFKIEGTADNYQIQLNADVQQMVTANKPLVVSIIMRAKGNEQQLAFEQLQVKPATGEFNLKGQLSWVKAPSFDFLISAVDINPADFATDIAGKLNLSLTAQGNLAGDKTHAEIDIKELSGSIHGQAILAKGHLSLTDKQLEIQQLRISAGKNSLVSNGYLSEQQADLTLTVNAPDLQSAWPSLTGSIVGSAAVTGTLLKPNIKSKLNGQNMGYENQHIAKLSLFVDYLHASQQQSKINFSAQDIDLTGHKIKHLSLKGQGNADKHNAQLTINSTIANLDFKTRGQWDGKLWQGQISQLDIQSPQLKRWQLDSVSQLSIAKSKNGLFINLPTSCLIQSDARLCVTAKSSVDNQLDGRLKLSNWPLAMIKPWLPESLSFAGLVSAEADFVALKNDVTATLDATISEGKAKFTDEDKRTHEILLTNSKLQLQFEHDRLVSSVFLGLGLEDFIQADINVGQANSAAARSLSGTVNATIANFALIDSLLPDIQQLQGTFVSDLQIAGNTQQPIIFGSAKWQEGQFAIPALGTTLRNINLQLNSDSANSERLLLDAKMQSGKGHLLVKGTLNLQPKQHFPMKLSISGEQFQVSRLAEAEISISPMLKIDKQHNLTNIEGLIKIDQAKVEIKSLPENVIAPSADEIIISDQQPNGDKVDNAQLNSHIVINFGDDSHFSGFGLDADLVGELEYIVKQGKQNVQGRAEMKQASYQSYGQDLTIRKGEFLFNGPADNPWLNIEAIRKANTDAVTAVLQVTGLLKSPQTRVYSEPALTESEALAYLVTGNSLSNMNKSEGNALANAAFNYGAGQLSWISDQLGIDEFEFLQGEKIEDSAVKLGQYLNPDLYIGVTMGLFASNYAANLRYRLTDNFSIHTRAGETQRIDLKYHVEIE